MGSATGGPGRGWRGHFLTGEDAVIISIQPAEFALLECPPFLKRYPAVVVGVHGVEKGAGIRCGRAITGVLTRGRDGERTFPQSRSRGGFRFFRLGRLGRVVRRRIRGLKRRRGRRGRPGATSKHSCQGHRQGAEGHSRQFFWHSLSPGPGFRFQRGIHHGPGLYTKHGPHESLAAQASGGREGLSPSGPTVMVWSFLHGFSRQGSPEGGLLLAPASPVRS